MSSAPLLFKINGMKQKKFLPSNPCGKKFADSKIVWNKLLHLTNNQPPPDYLMSRPLVRSNRCEHYQIF